MDAVAGTTELIYNVFVMYDLYTVLSANFFSLFFLLNSNASIGLAQVPKPYADTRPALRRTSKQYRSTHRAEKSRDS